MYCVCVISLSTNGHLIIINSKFVNNSTPRAGGAIFTEDNSLIDVSYTIFNGNKADVGGAIYQETNTTKLNQCCFLGNSDSALIGIKNQISIEDSYFQNNMGQHFGAAVSMLNRSVLNVSNTTFKNNSQYSTINLNRLQFLYKIFYTNATVGGGAAILLSESIGNISKSGFYNNYASFWGGAMYLFNSSLSVSNTTFENNIAGAFGSVIYNHHSFLNIEYSNFKNNSVLNNLRRILRKYGGAIAANFTKIIMTNSSLAANTGSAIYLIDGVSLDINNCTFFNNSTPDGGGAIMCLVYCDVKIVNSNLSRNKALTAGGALCVHNKVSKFTVHNCSFTYNIAYFGGAMSVSDSDFSISDSDYSNNIAFEGGVTELAGNLVMTNCRIINNTAYSHGGVVKLVNGSLQMLNCLVSYNTADTNGGVVFSTESTTVITNCIFKMNSALGSGGVFYVQEGGKTISRNSSFVNNSGKNVGGVLVSRVATKVLISDIEISQNSGNAIGAIWIDSNSVLELNGSQVVNNNAQYRYGALLVSNNSLLVAFNSSFKGNTAYQDSSLVIENSTAYLENCTFMEHFQTSYGGTISLHAAILKIANTFFTHNIGYDMYYYGTKVHFINRLETYRCSFKHDNLSLKSNTTFFEQVAVRENIMNNASTPDQIHTAFQETPYASSKMFIYLP